MTTGGVLKAKVRVPRVTGLARERLDGLLAGIWQARLALIVAPAGSGKTTLLAQFASRCGAPVAWYRAEPADAGSDALVAHLERSITATLDGVPGGWTTIDDAIDALEDWAGERALVVVDELDAVWGTEAEAALERFVHNVRPGIPVLAATRRAPTFNLSRLKVQGELLHLGQHDLRFRTWEVERLFSEFYGDPMPPHDLAELERRTGGWAAGLQLFHLATRGKPAIERRRVLHELAVRARLLREYLARNVLDELPVHVRDFLVQTCVLGRLTPALCDALTGATSSAAILADLEHRQVFTSSLDDGESFRYHEVLRTHLEAVLVETVGEAEARLRFRRAGELLETAGYLPEALRAYGRAEDWPAATRLVGGWGEQLIDRPGEWLDALPPALLDQDAWLLLGSARRCVMLGRWEAALDAYARAEAVAGAAQPGPTAQRERQALAAWFEPPVPSPSDWTAVARLALARDPRAVVRRDAAKLPPAVGAFIEGGAALVAGDLDDAVALLGRLRARPDATPLVVLGARFAGAVAAALAGSDEAAELAAVSEEADEQGAAWVGEVARAALALVAGAPADAAPLRVEKEDVWGTSLASLFAGLGEVLRGGEASEPRRAGLLDAAAAFDSLHAPVLAAWARLAAAAGRNGDVPRAAGVARSLGLAGAVTLVAGRRGSGRATTGQLSPDASGSPIVVRCLGPFAAWVHGEPIDLAAIKPRVRSLLRLLAMHAGQPVHRERIVECLWPEEPDARSGTRNLQVAISSLRQLLEPGVARGAATIVVRDGDTYRLAFASDDDVDVCAFTSAVAAARAARVSGDATTAAREYERALGLYAGELLADEGPAEWVVAERDRLQALAVEAATALAELAIDAGDAPAAAAVAERGLRIDRFQDGLWRLLVRALGEAGDTAAARRAQERYDAVLRELGV